MRKVCLCLGEKAGKFWKRRREFDTAEGCDRVTEIDLVVIDVFAQLGRAWNNDRHYPPGPRFRNCAWATVTDNYIGLIQQSRELVHLEELSSGALRASRCGAPLNKEPLSLVGVGGQPVVDPVDKPVEGMVIGSDRNDNSANGWCGRHLVWEEGHSRQPITCPRG